MNCGMPVNSENQFRKRLAILGSTGSIGTQALDVAEKLCNKVAIIKEGLTMRGIPIGLPRRPIHPLPDSVRAELTAVMRDFGYYKLG